MEGCQSEGVARIVPSQQNRADDLAHSVCTPRSYGLHEFVN